MKKYTILLQLCLLAAVALAGNAQTPADDHALISRLASFRFGGDTKVPMAVAERVSAARLNPQSRRVVAHELAVILRESRSYDVRQFVCRQLVFVGSTEQVPALAGLLTNEDLAQYALLPLARIPGKSVNDALLRALPHTHGRTTVAILDTLADRGDTRAMAASVGMLSSQNPEYQAGAAHAVAKLPDARAAAALIKAYAGLRGTRRLAVGDALLDCALRSERRGSTPTADAIYKLLSDTSASPILRAGALRGMTRVHPDRAAALVCAALGEDRTLRQKMAADIAREIPGAAATQELSACLPKLNQHGQLLLLAALSDRRDRAAAPAVTALCRKSGAVVRTAALLALGSVGDPGSVPLLLSIAAGNQAEERDAARESLGRMRGNAVDKALAASLRTKSSKLKVEAIQALGQRGAASSVAPVVDEARNSDPKVRAAAFRVLRDLGRPALLPHLVDLMLTTPADDRAEEIETITEVARRGSSAAGRTGLFLHRLSAVTLPADKISLLAILGQLGDTAGLPALRAGLTDTNADVQMTALSALADWPNDEPISDLLGVVQTSADPRQRAVALRGYLQMAVSNEQRAPVEALKLLRGVAPNASLAGDKRILLAGAARIGSPEALEFAASYTTDADVRPEAETAVAAIGQATVGAYPEKTRAILDALAREGTNEEARKRAAAILATQAKFGDFIVAWEVSPIYLREGSSYQALFDIPFAPEQAGSAAQVPWRLMPAGTSPDQPWLLDLLAALGGEQRVAYLRTCIQADAARDLILELGSDDGIKVWWNGQKVFGNNVARGVFPAEEKVAVHANQGWNSLLLKITQNNMGWGACARATNPDGSPAAGLHFAAPSSLPAP